MHRKNRKIFILLTASILIFKSCGLFETREPEKPETIRSTYEPPTTPEINISNLTYSILEKNSENYLKCLSPTNYLYVPDAKSLSTYGQIFQNWNTNSEKYYYENLISETNPNASSTLFFSEQTTQMISSDSAVTNAEYILVFQHNRTNLPKSAVGTLRLSLKANESNYFYISKWEDFRKNDSDFTWSELKANFSN